MQKKVIMYLNSFDIELNPSHPALSRPFLPGFIPVFTVKKSWKPYLSEII